MSNDNIKLGKNMIQCVNCKAVYMPSSYIAKENIDGLIQEKMRESLKCPVCGLLNEKVDTQQKLLRG